MASFGSIGTTVKLMDGMSAGFSRIINAVNLTVSALRTMSNMNVDIKGLDNIQNELNMAGAEMSRFKDALANAGNGIGNNAKAQRQWNTEINNGKNGMSGLVNKLKTALGVYALINAGKKLINLSDEIVTIDARLNLITDTTAQKNNLKNAIYQSAQDARAPLNNFANNVAKVGQLAGQHFANNGEIVKFNNLMAKSFKISGASAQETAAAMYQLNQAMASGVLQGDEFRSIRENAPMLAQGIVKAMGVGMDALKDLSRDGAITADVIKKAVFGMENDINKSFKQMPMTWKDVWTKASNTTIKALEPVLFYINKLANSEKFQGFVNGVTNAFKTLGTVASAVLNGIATVASFMYDNWSVIEPIVYGVAGAVAFYAAMQALASLATVAHGVALAGMVIADFAAIAATEGLATAFGTLNAAVWAFPGTWLAAAVIGIVVAVGAAILATVKWVTGTMTWAGVMVGAFGWVKAVITNYIYSIVYVVGSALAVIWNGFASAANFIGNVMRDPAAAFINFVKDMAIQALTILQGLAGAVDKVLGTGMASTFEGWKGHIQGVGTSLGKKFGNGQYKTVVELKSAADFGMDLQRKSLGFEYSAWAAKGNRWAKKAGELGDFFDPNNLGGVPKGDGIDKVGDNTGKTAKNTGKMADKLDDTEEEMKYLRELAEQEHINQFTTAEIKVDMNNTNHIEKGMDIDEITRKLREQIEEEMSRAAERRYD